MNELIVDTTVVTSGRHYGNITFWLKNPCERDHFEKLGIRGKIMLKQI
jgi:hypothetical protein